MMQILAIGKDSPLTQEEEDFLADQLPGSMMDQAKKYRRWQDAQAYLLGKFLLIHGSKRYGFDNTILRSIQYTRNNRPYIPGFCDFNISHAGKYVLCAMSPGSRVGIDIENIHVVDFHDFKNCFTTAEFTKINTSHDRYREFFKYWTIKEAVIKADGRGLSIPLNTIHATDKINMNGKNWHIHPLEIDINYQAHLAIDAALPGNISIEHVMLHPQSL